MACGRPTVCTNVGGVAEAVGDTGIVVAPRDLAAVAKACVELLRDHDRRRRLGAAARARVLEHFTLSQSLQMYRNVYEGLATPLVAGEPPRHLRERVRDAVPTLGGPR
jgi:glycosyltransferase involved in cell wall biosynthesis